MLHSEELHSLNRSPNVFRVIKSRRLRWTGHVVRMKEGKSSFKILTGKTKGMRLLGRLDVDVRIILEWRWVSIRGTGLIRFRIEITEEPL